MTASSTIHPSNETFEEVLAARLSRRQVVGGGAAAAALASIGGVSSLLTALPAQARAWPPASAAAGLSRHSDVHRRRRRRAARATRRKSSSRGAIRFPTARRSKTTRATAPTSRHGNGACTTTASCTFRSAAPRQHGLLVQNNEYTDDVLLFPDGTANWNQEKTNKSINAHGVSIIEIRKEGRRRPGQWHKWHRRGRCGSQGRRMGSRTSLGVRAAASPA